MLLKVNVLQAIVEGDISLVFRRWKKPSVKPGGTLLTSLGQLAIGDVRCISESEITDRQARLAGYDQAADLLHELNARSHGKIYRIEVSYRGVDPRVSLRNTIPEDQGEVEAILLKLERMDKLSRRGAWTRLFLDLIEKMPATLAAELASEADWQRAAFKANVRKLKALGLTESLPVGYRLSPRGVAVQAAIRQAR